MLNIQYRPTYFSIIPIPKLSLACTVKHYIRAPVTSATLHDWNQNSRRFKSCSSRSSSLNIDFQTTLNASFPKNNAAVRCWRSEMWGVFHSVPWNHSSLLSSPFPTLLTIVQFSHFSATYLFVLLHIFFVRWWWLTMTRFYPPSSWCHIHRTVQILVDSTTVLTTTTTQHGYEYNSTPRTSLPLPVDSTRTSEFNVTVHNDKLIDSAHYTTHDISTSQSLHIYVAIERQIVYVSSSVAVDSTA